MVEPTARTGIKTAGVDTLGLVGTTGAGDHPANTTGVDPVVEAVKTTVRRRWADPQIVGAVTPWFPSAPGILPAILTARHVVTRRIAHTIVSVRFPTS